MLRRLTALALVIAASAAFASAAQAHLVAHPKSHMLKDVAASQWTNYRHARYVCNHGAHASKRWSCAAKVWLLREYNESYRAMHPELSYPPHHSLWMCIHGHEASDWQNQDTGHNGHYNGLQMHWNWGYGISGNPANYTQLEIEWAAERGWNASNHSTRWLMGQWAHYDCLRYV